MLLGALGTVMLTGCRSTATTVREGDPNSGDPTVDGAVSLKITESD